MVIFYVQVILKYRNLLLITSTRQRRCVREYATNRKVAGLNPDCRSQWSRGLRRGFAADRVLGLQVRIPLGAVVCVVQ
jgi:hypothetical protein